MFIVAFEEKMDPSDTSSSGQETRNPMPVRYEVVSSVPRGEPMLSGGVVAGFTISAPPPPVTYTPSPLAAAPNVSRAAPTYSIDMNHVENSPGFALSDFLTQLEDYTPTVIDNNSSIVFHSLTYYIEK